MIKKILTILKMQDKNTNKETIKKTPKKKKVKSTRIGDLGEYKINIQLEQLKDSKSFHDLLILNPESKTGYSQIDHLVVNPYGIFVIETKNYAGEIKGARKDKIWYVNNRFKMYNPIFQNYGHIQAIKAFLKDYDMKFISIITFTMRCRFSIDPDLRKPTSDELVIYDVELSNFIERKINRLKLEQVSYSSKVDEIAKLIEQINITDPKVREVHKQRAGM